MEICLFVSYSSNSAAEIEMATSITAPKEPISKPPRNTNVYGLVKNCISSYKSPSSEVSSITTYTTPTLTDVPSKVAMIAAKDFSIQPCTKSTDTIVHRITKRILSQIKFTPSL